MISDRDKKIIKYIQEDLPLTPRPFKSIAEKVGMEERELLKRIEEMKEEGIMRRLGAVVHHYQAGYAYNAMACWQVPLPMIEKAGVKMSRYREVSHVYQRPSHPPHWPYNLFTMIHGHNREDCERIAEKMAEETGVKKYILIYSVREFKKTSMKYF
ncbi:MAG: Lrp/AsnC family transcriptional regulator [Candidatus Syntrophonatronum acetioxidans]|uniref:siroheme decarboxylase n=1 Tax=Candidatus Syntrophonatronum acetioxidans TaxID=1795816 RepID=A0A424Y9A6_9FIRM|nr:MAG: Lrp/AsnC family transcriptional regulator [Candidatus Syntrophonatronum acetioxidans]